jgi:hypothetical protein
MPPRKTCISLANGSKFVAEPGSRRRRGERGEVDRRPRDGLAAQRLSIDAHVGELVGCDLLHGLTKIIVLPRYLSPAGHGAGFDPASASSMPFPLGGLNRNALHA